MLDATLTECFEVQYCLLANIQAHGCLAEPQLLVQGDVQHGDESRRDPCATATLLCGSRHRTVLDALIMFTGPGKCAESNIA